MEHLALEVFDLTGTGSKYADLAKDDSITITDTSEIFASGDVWSYSFTLNVYANAHIFGTAGDMHGSRLHDSINKRRARLWVEGHPLYLGYLKLDDEAEVDEDGNVDVSFESGNKTFGEMIEGAKANQVPMMGNVRIGVALWRKRWSIVGLGLTASAEMDNGKTSEAGEITTDFSPTGYDDNDITFAYDGEDEGNSVQQYPRMVFPKGRFVNASDGTPVDIDCINTDYPYDDGHPYCNVAMCYQKYGYEKKNEKGEIYPDYAGEPEAQRGYEYMAADRINSAPNFYVIYWIKALMKHLGIYIEENQMMDVEDLRRLFFLNSKCDYKEPKRLRKGYNGELGRYVFTLEARLVAEQFDPKSLIKTTECGFKCTSYTLKKKELPVLPDGYVLTENPDISKLSVDVNAVRDLPEVMQTLYEQQNGYLHDAYATSECFPNANIDEVIKAIESGFGIRFLFSDNYQRVRIVLLRNIFRNKDIQDITCDTISDMKTENAIRGFRMTYGNTEDTHFYYKGFADKLPHMKTLWPDTSDTHDYSHWMLDADYAAIINKVSAFDKTCYVTRNNGNAYGIKVDKDAKRYDELHPSLFEFAGFMDAEDGDCTGEEDTIETINIGFTPVIVNDLNMEEEREENTRRQRFAIFVDEKMRPRRPYLVKQVGYVSTLYKLYGPDGTFGSMCADGVVKPGEFAITSDMYAVKPGDGISTLSAVIVYNAQAINPGPRLDVRRFQIKYHVNLEIEGHVNEGYRLYLDDNYEPNDDGISPIESHDWGLALGIMRGSGSDAYVNYEADNRDSEGNDTWNIVSGSSVTAHSDTCDSYGGEWKYVDSKYATSENAAQRFAELFPDSDAPFSAVSSYGVDIFNITDDADATHKALVVTPYPPNNHQLEVLFRSKYISALNGHTAAEIVALDKAGVNGYRNMMVELDSSYERCDTLRQLIRLAHGYDSTIIIDNGVDSRYGRFSLKLRAEKPNPYYEKGSTDEEKERQYLDITNPNLRGRGLADQFYKEYSYWVRNARICKKTVHMELAQLLKIDKTKRVRVGDVTGFIRKMQYTVSNSDGLGNVTMEIMYI